MHVLTGRDGCSARVVENEVVSGCQEWDKDSGRVDARRAPQRKSCEMLTHWAQECHVALLRHGLKG